MVGYILRNKGPDNEGKGQKIGRREGSEGGGQLISRSLLISKLRAPRRAGTRRDTLGLSSDRPLWVLWLHLGTNRRVAIMKTRPG